MAAASPAKQQPKPATAAKAAAPVQKAAASAATLPAAEELASFGVTVEAEPQQLAEGYKPWRDPVKKSAAFGELESLMRERIIFIDGAMGTQIQKYKLQEADFRGERWVAAGALAGGGWAQQ